MADYKIIEKYCPSKRRNVAMRVDATNKKEKCLESDGGCDRCDRNICDRVN